MANDHAGTSVILVGPNNIETFLGAQKGILKGDAVCISKLGAPCQLKEPMQACLCHKKLSLLLSVFVAC